jgi:hypothetical protein
MCISFLPAVDHEAVSPASQQVVDKEAQAGLPGRFIVAVASTSVDLYLDR